MGTVRIETLGFDIITVRLLFDLAAKQASREFLGYPVAVRPMTKTLLRAHRDGVIVSPEFSYMKYRMNVPFLVVDISNCHDTSQQVEVIRKAIIHLAQQAVAV